MLLWYTKVLCHHPYLVLSSVVIVVGTCLGLSLFARPLPNFNDPALGFESRGTVISERSTAWENLLESIGPRGPLVVNPLDNPFFHARVPSHDNKTSKHKHKICVEMTPHGFVEVPDNCTELDNRTRNPDSTFSFVHFEEIRKIATNQDPPSHTEANTGFSPDYHWQDVDDGYETDDEHHDHNHLGPDGFFCGELLPGYGHIVIESSIPGDTLFSYRNMMAICELDRKLRSVDNMKTICQESKPNNCCPSWSLPNYIARLSNRTSCFDITERDIAKVRQKLRHCARFFDLEIEGGCGSSGCGKLPVKCLEAKEIFTILHYLTDAAFLQPQSSGRDRRPLATLTSVSGVKSPHSPHSPQKTLVNTKLSISGPRIPVGLNTPLTTKAGVRPHSAVGSHEAKKQRHHLQHLGQRQIENKLSLTTIFLPIPRSTQTMPYFEKLQKMDLRVKNVSVVAMDLGLKNDVFNLLLLADTYLLCIGGGLVVLLIWIYTGSLFITIITITTVACSLLIAYFLYVFIYDIAFFPYMNVLTAVIAIGLGADDTFVYCRVWTLAKQDANCGTMMKLINDAINHAAASICVTSFTTAAAFLASYTSHITAIKCFSVFAGTVVLANLVLMVTWMPACVVVAERWGASSCCLCVPPNPVYATDMNPRCSSLCAWPLKGCYSVTDMSKLFFDKVLPCLVIKPRYLWIVLLGGLAIGSAFVVFYFPGLRLPDTQEFQLFDGNHPFEKYDLKYKYDFWFERNLRRDIVNRLPIRMVWGVLPVDNGDYLDPSSKGTLQYDEEFDMAAPESQLWLLEFCRSLRNQSFYMSTLGPLLPNCFIETFKVSMQRRCQDPINGFDRFPCCENSTFPYKREVFEQCIHHDIALLYQTPSEYFIRGVAGPKFSKETGKIKAVVVEYDSTYIWSLSYDEMDSFYEKVEAWVQEQLLTAPAGMKNGWFISYLDFYDVQRALSIGTGIAVAVAVSVCLAVLLLTTLNFIVSLLAIVSVAAVMVVTLAALVLLGWRLNVLESVTVSVAIGLAVDLTIHYGVAYRLAPESERNAAVTWAAARLGGPVFMAALTTACAGVVMIPARVLAYVHVGTFLTILTTCSYVYATFFYLPLLRIFGPEAGFGQFSYQNAGTSCCKKDATDERADKTVYQQAFISESTLSTSSNCCPTATTATNISDNHELEPLTSRGSLRSSSKKRHSSVSRVSSGSHSVHEEAGVPPQPYPHPHFQTNGGSTVLHASGVASILADTSSSKKKARSGSLSSSLSLKERRERVLRKISLPSPGDEEACEMAEPSPRQVVCPALSATTILYSEPETEINLGPGATLAPHSPRLPPRSPSYAPHSPSYLPHYQHVQLLSPKRKASCSSPSSAVGTDNTFTT